MSLLFDVQSRAADLDRRRLRRAGGDNDWWKQVALTAAVTPFAQEFSTGVGNLINRGSKNAQRAYQASTADFANNTLRAVERAKTLLADKEEQDKSGLDDRRWWEKKHLPNIQGNLTDSINTRMVMEDGKEVPAFGVNSSYLDDKVLKSVARTFVPEKEMNEQIEARNKALQEARDLLEADDYKTLIAQGYTGGASAGDRFFRRIGAMIRGESLEEIQDRSVKAMRDSPWSKDIGEFNSAYNNFQETKDYNDLEKTFRKSKVLRTLVENSIKPEFRKSMSTAEKFKITADGVIVRYMEIKHTDPVRGIITTTLKLDESTALDKDGNLKTKSLVSNLPNLHTFANAAGFSDNKKAEFFNNANTLLRETNPELNILTLPKLGTLEEYNKVAQLLETMLSDAKSYQQYSDALRNYHVGAIDRLAKTVQGLETIQRAYNLVDPEFEEWANKNYNKAFDDLTRDEVMDAPYSEIAKRAQTKYNDRVRAREQIATLLSGVREFEANQIAIQLGLATVSPDNPIEIIAVKGKEEELNQFMRTFKFGDPNGGVQ